ncbi:hypothetical protein D3C87_262330 [compost metagenome]
MITTAIIATAGFIFLLLPGFAFLRALWGSAHGPIETNNFYHYMTWGLLISVSIYSLAFTLDYDYELKYLYKWLIADKTVTFDNVYKYSSKLLLYAIGVTAVSWIFGLILGALILRSRIGEWFPPLRFKSDWYYYFSGRSYTTKKDFDTRIEFLFEAGDSLIIYRGMLDNYRLKDDDSEYVRLIDVERTGIIQWEKLHLQNINSKDEITINTKPRFYSISPNEIMLFKIVDMKNVRLIYFDQDGDNSAAQELPQIPESA